MQRSVPLVWPATCLAVLIALGGVLPSLADDVDPGAATMAVEDATMAAEDTTAAAGDAAQAVAETEATSAAPSGLPIPPFRHDPERELEWDWVQISSGEWLKGTAGRMHRETFHFDSDEFGDVTFDWADVVTLVTKGVVTIRIEDAESLIGRMTVRGKVVRMHTDTGVHEVPQGKVMAMIPGTPTELNYWSGGFSFGVSARSGNTQQSDISLRGSLVRQTEMTRWRTTYTGEISSANGDQTANSHRVPSQFDIYLTRDFFLSTPTFEFYTDEFQNISTRLTPGLGLGYDVIDNSWLFWEVATGIAYQYTDYISVSPGDDPVDHDAAAVFKTIVNFDMPFGIEWDNLYALQIVVTDPDKTSHHAESALSFDIWGPLEVEFAVIFDRIEKPVANSSGSRPKSNDLRFTAGLGIDF